MDNPLQPNEISPEEVRAALHRVAASPGFVDAGRLAAFLRYLAEQTLSGEAGSIKESVIGVAVFQREPGYDPRIDPIVRVEARRLRSRLAEYYAGPGLGDRVVIELPKGTYVPAFGRSLEPAARSQEAGRRKGAGLSRWWAGAAVAMVLGVAGLAWFVMRKGPAVGATPSVVVLPFVNVSADRGDEYFSDGLTEELINELARVDGIRVVSRSSAFQFKGKTADVKEVAARFGVGAVLEGSVRKSADRLRIAVQLVNSTDGYPLWAQTYDREMKDVFAVQEEIARAIVGALRVKLRVAGGGPPRRYTTNVEAYNLYLQGRFHWNRFSDEGFRRAVEYARQAVRADAGYALAHALMSQVYAMMAYYRVLPAEEAWGKAKEAAQQAVALDDGLAEAHAALGAALALHDWNWAGGEREFRRALELNPASAEAHQGYAMFSLVPHGRLEEANAEFRKALELDPLAVFTNFAASFTLMASKQYDAAIVQYQKTLELKSDFDDIWWDRGMALALGGHQEEAARSFRKAYEVDGHPRQQLGLVESALVGDLARVRELLPRIDAWAAGGKGTPMEVVYCYAMAGDKDRAFTWLQKALAAKDPWVAWLKVDPRVESLRMDARFPGVLKRVGLE